VQRVVQHLGHLDEGDAAVECDQEQRVALCALDQGRRDGVEAGAELEYKGGDLALGEVGDESFQGRLSAADPYTGREDQLTAAEDRGESRELADVGPADRAVEALGVGQDLGGTGREARQLERVGDRDPRDLVVNRRREFAVPDIVGFPRGCDRSSPQS
jgi:hypothetical protein